MDLDSRDNLYPPLGVNKPIWISGTSRVDLLRHFAQQGFRVGAEIGVGSAPFSIKALEIIPDLELYCIDLWKPYEGYIDYDNPEHLEGDYQKALERLSYYPKARVIRKDSMCAVRDFPHGFFDFVYIDANHDRPWIDNDIYWWAQKVRPGGIVSGHDFMNGHLDTILAVEWYTKVNHVHPWYCVGRENETGEPDLIPSWFWIKGEHELYR